jgi:predicted ester cyclase
MSSEQNERIVRRFYEALNVNDRAKIDHIIAEYVAPDVIVHDPVLGDMVGVQGYHRIVHTYLQAFPQQQIIVDKIIVDGDTAAVLHTHIGKNTGPFMGIAPTGKQVKFEGLEMIRLIDGKVVEFWRHDDDAGLMRQLGPIFAMKFAWRMFFGKQPGGQR